MATLAEAERAVKSRWRMERSQLALKRTPAANALGGL